MFLVFSCCLYLSDAFLALTNVEGAGLEEGDARLVCCSEIDKKIQPAATQQTSKRLQAASQAVQAPWKMQRRCEEAVFVGERKGGGEQGHRGFDGEGARFNRTL